MKEIDTTRGLEAALAEDRAILYKHSPVCGLSARARRQIDRFKENFPDAPVFLIDVIAHRSVSNEVESRLGIRHESPQIILVHDGEPVADASHHEVRADTMGDWWDGDVVLG